MDFNATIDLIIKDLEETREIIDDLKKYPGVPLLQVELAKSKCKSAGEVIGMLKTILAVPPVADKEPVVYKDPAPPEIRNSLPEEEKKKEIKPGRITPVREEKKKDTSLRETALPPKEDETVQITVVKEETELTMVADKYINPSNSLSEQFGNMKSDEALSDKLKTKPLSNLADGIGVNDKFIFIREIFNGDSNDYSQAISRLDATESIMDAMEILMSYAGPDSNKDSIEQLLGLVKRKLHSNG